MNDLKERLAQEKEAFLFWGKIIRRASSARGLEKIDISSLLQDHLNCCEDYFNIHGTTKGESSPWITKDPE